MIRYAICLGLFFTTLAATKPSSAYVKVGKMALVPLVKGGAAEALVRLEVEKGIHIQANPASAPQLIPTTVTVEEASGIQVGQAIYPPSKPHRLKGSDAEIATYEGKVEIRIPLTATVSAPQGKHTLKGKVRYQACDETTCFFPVTTPLDVVVQVK